MVAHSSLLLHTPAELRLNLNYLCRDCLLLSPPISGVHLWVVIVALLCRVETAAVQRVCQGTWYLSNMSLTIQTLDLSYYGVIACHRLSLMVVSISVV